MIDDILIFDDVLSIEEQDFLLNFVVENPNKFDVLENVVGKVYTTKNGEKIETDNYDLYQIIHYLEIKICKKLEIEFLQNSIQKINWLEPLGRECNELEFINWNTIEQNYVLIYYINDSDGDTRIYTNKNDASQYVKDFSEDGINPNCFKLLKSINPKKGRVVFFNGKYPHCTTYPTNDNRFVININFMAKEPKKNKSLI